MQLTITADTTNVRNLADALTGYADKLRAGEALIHQPLKDAEGQTIGSAIALHDENDNA